MYYIKQPFFLMIAFFMHDLNHYYSTIYSKIFATTLFYFGTSNIYDITYKFFKSLNKPKLIIDAETNDNNKLWYEEFIIKSTSKDKLHNILLQNVLSPVKNKVDVIVDNSILNNDSIDGNINTDIDDNIDIDIDDNIDNKLITNNDIIIDNSDNIFITKTSGLINIIDTNSIIYINNHSGLIYIDDDLYKKNKLSPTNSIASSHENDMEFIVTSSKRREFKRESTIEEESNLEKNFKWKFW